MAPLPRSLPWVLAAGLSLSAAQVHAAGGHFAIDDAAILDAGACKADGWASRSPGDAWLLHAGGGCRVGPVELGAGTDDERVPGGSQTAWGIGIKWAAPLGNALSVGASLGPAWQARARPRYQGTAATLLLTWQASERIALHANLGRDFANGGPDASLGGVSAAWRLREHWTVIAERFRAEQTQFARIGLRWQPAPGWALDASRRHRIAGPAGASWTLGLSREFERP